MKSIGVLSGNIMTDIPGNPITEISRADWKEDFQIANRYEEIFTFQVFNYKLGHSRYCHFVYRTTKTQQDIFDCLIDSFKVTGGVPREILFDNMATIVDLKGKRRHINNKAKAFADDMGFRIRLAKPRHPYTKGKVEAANKFLDWILPYEGEFETEEDLIRIIEEINKDVNQEICQETGVPPLLLFQKEKEYLQSLPESGILESYMSHDCHTTVQSDSLVNYGKRKYSVPPEYIGKKVSIRLTDDNRLQIYYNTDLISVHNVSEKRKNYKKEHYVALLENLINDRDTVEKMAEANLKRMDDFL